MLTHLKEMMSTGNFMTDFCKFGGKYVPHIKEMNWIYDIWVMMVGGSSEWQVRVFFEYVEM